MESILRAAEFAATTSKAQSSATTAAGSFSRRLLTRLEAEGWKPPHN